MQELRSFAELRQLIADLPKLDQDAAERARQRQQIMTKPPGSLGRLEEIAIWLCGWQACDRPHLVRCQTIVFAGNHGIAARGVSAYPAEVTTQMVLNFERGGAAISQLCLAAGARLDVHALDLDEPTADFTVAPAMTEAACIEAIERGMAAVDPEADLVLLGEMGIGNTTVAAALCCALYGGVPSDWAGRGTGVDDRTLALKAEVVAVAVARHRAALADPLTVLATFGGRELAAIAGAVVAARQRRIPVLLDGFVCTAAAAPLARLRGDALEHCLVGHVSAEAGHRLLLERLGQRALLDLDMRLGEASGAAVALGILRAAIATHNGMATFAEAGVSERGS